MKKLILLILLGQIFIAPIAINAQITVSEADKDLPVYHGNISDPDCKIVSQKENYLVIIYKGKTYIVFK